MANNRGILFKLLLRDFGGVNDKKKGKRKVYNYKQKSDKGGGFVAPATTHIPFVIL